MRPAASGVATKYLARPNADVLANFGTGWQARGQRDVQPQVTRVTDRLATFLTLAGLTALLTGGVLAVGR